MKTPDSIIAFEAAIESINAVIDDMKHGGLDGANPTWAATMAVSLVEARNAIYSGMRAVEAESAVVETDSDLSEVDLERLRSQLDDSRNIALHLAKSEMRGERFVAVPTEGSDALCQIFDLLEGETVDVMTKDECKNYGMKVRQ